MCIWYLQLRMIMITGQIENQTTKADNRVIRDRRHHQHQDRLMSKDKELLLKIRLDQEQWGLDPLKIQTLALIPPFSKIITGISLWKVRKLCKQIVVTPRNSNMIPFPTNLTIAVYMWGLRVPLQSKAPTREVAVHPTTEVLIAHNSTHLLLKYLRWEVTKNCIVRLLIKKGVLEGF